MVKEETSKDMINAVDDQGVTPLILAATQSFYLVDLLLSHGASVTASRQVWITGFCQGIQTKL